MKRVSTSSSKGNGMKTKILYGLVALLLIVVVAGGVFGYREYSQLKQENQRLSNPEEAARSEIENTKAQIAGLIEVPTDEEPTVADVVDASKLSGQEFFKNAENGDKLVVYQNAQKAILYRPSSNKIIEVSTINIGDEQPDESDDTQTPEPTNQSNIEEVGQPGLE